MSDIEYSVITSDVIKSFDCIFNRSTVFQAAYKSFAINKITQLKCNENRAVYHFIQFNRINLFLKC